MKLTRHNLDNSYFPEWVINSFSMYKLKKGPRVTKEISGAGVAGELRKFCKIEIQGKDYLADISTGTLWRDGKCLTSGTLRMADPEVKE